MSRLENLPLNDLTEAQKKAYLGTMGDHGTKIQGPAVAWLRSPGLYEHLAAMISFMRYQSVLSPRIREFAILIVIADWDSPFPWSKHAPMAKEAGLAADIIEALRAHQQPHFSNEDEQTVYAFCAELREEHAVSHAIYQAMLDQVGEQGLVELTTLLGLYATVCMTSNAFEIPVAG